MEQEMFIRVAENLRHRLAPFAVDLQIHLRLHAAVENLLRQRRSVDEAENPVTENQRAEPMKHTVVR